jgi:hypothetical protein
MGSSFCSTVTLRRERKKEAIQSFEFENSSSEEDPHEYANIEWSSEEDPEEYAHIQWSSAEELEVQELNSNAKQGRKEGLCWRKKN